MAKILSKESQISWASQQAIAICSEMTHMKVSAKIKIQTLALIDTQIVVVNGQER